MKAKAPWNMCCRILLAGLGGHLWAADVTWTGNISSNWYDPNNWNPVTVPTNTDKVIITEAPAGRMPVCWIPEGGTTLVRSVELGTGTTTVTLTTMGLGVLACEEDFRVGARGILTHLTNGGSVAEHKLSVVCRDFILDTGGRVDVTACGFQGTNGPGYSAGGAGVYWPGASHGGRGGTTFKVDSMPTYGSPSQPVDLGSGGALTNDPVHVAGGGAVRIVATGTATLHGTIQANGTNRTLRRAGGSGGSIWIEAGTLQGTGWLIADGGSRGDSASGGGAGGRIALSYTSLAESAALTVFVRGGRSGGVRTAEMGTFAPPPTYFAGKDVVVTEALFALAPGEYEMNSLLINTNGALEICAGSGVVSRLVVNGTLTVRSNGWLYVRGDTNTLYGTGCEIVAQNALIDRGGGISASGKGFWRRTGPGAGQWLSSAYWTGGSHGGDGGITYLTHPRGYTYGSPTNPTSLGCGAVTNVSDGGGAVKLTVSGTLTLNGVVAADGLDEAGGSPAAYRGGGSGGSVWIQCGTLTGSGVISARGGHRLLSTSDGSGGGSGGRVALYAGDRSGFTGSIVVAGGRGGEYSGLGYPYDRGRAGTFFAPQFAVPPGGNLVLTNDMAIPAGFTYYFTTVLITNGAALELQSDTNAVGAGSGGTNYGVGATIVAQNLTVAQGSFLSADALGFRVNQGPGKGNKGATYGTGGSYGGKGGYSLWSPLPSPTWGESISNRPTALGSGGSAGSDLNLGSGGGALRIDVGGQPPGSGVLLLDGRICADGGRQMANYVGAGSGGSVWLTAGRILGSGVISARGGTATNFPYCTGGGGGRVAVYYYVATEAFPSGTVQCDVSGGPGGTNSVSAEPGTCYVEQLSSVRGTLWMLW